MHQGATWVAGPVWRNWVHTGNQTGEEGLASEVLVVLLEVLLAGLDELDGSELEAAALEALDDGTNEATLCIESVYRYTVV